MPELSQKILAEEGYRKGIKGRAYFSFKKEKVSKRKLYNVLFCLLNKLLNKK